MKLKDLLLKYTDKDILKQLFILYPDQKQNKEGYIKALEEIRNLKPIRTSDKITIEKVKDDGEEYVDICMRRKGEHFSASFIDWRKMINMKIVAEGFTELDMICHCLWEMTWYGYSNKAIQKQGEELFKIAKEIKENE